MRTCRIILSFALVAWAAVAMAGDPGQVAAARQTIVGYYAAWAAHDIARYRSLCTPDYLILDDGEMSDLEQDIAYLRAHPEAWRGRDDHFDFRKVIVRGDEAYVVYFLNSEIRRGQAVERRRYLESAVLRRNAHGWQVFLLHSTKLAPGSKQTPG
jgi:ketosteroid isomerase-like protein